MKNHILDYEELKNMNIKTFLKVLNNKVSFKENLINKNFIFNILLYYNNQFNSIYINIIKLTKDILEEILLTSKNTFFFLDYKSENNYIEFLKFIRENKDKLLNKYLIIVKFKIKNGELIDKEKTLFAGLNEDTEIEKIKINLSEAMFFFTEDIEVILDNLDKFLLCFMQKIENNQSVCNAINIKEFLTNKDIKNKLNLLDLKEISINKNKIPNISFAKKEGIKNQDYNKNLFSKFLNYFNIKK